MRGEVEAWNAPCRASSARSVSGLRVFLDASGHRFPRRVRRRYAEVIASLCIRRPTALYPPRPCGPEHVDCL